MRRFKSKTVSAMLKIVILKYLCEDPSRNIIFNSGCKERELVGSYHEQGCNLLISIY